jgi:glycosyltransferase involved in cell wall biosynthesis
VQILLRSGPSVYSPRLPETFGLIFAEANSVGCPVLAHDHGAAAEVLGTRSGQLVVCRDDQAVVDTLRAWREGGRPRVELNREFELERVLNRWEEMLI